MRRQEKAVTELTALEQILWQGSTCQLALPDLAAPYIVTLNYGYHDGVLYFHSASEGHKIDLLRHNPQVGFSVVINLGIAEAEEACNFGARFRSIVGYGRVNFVTELAEKRQAFALLMAQYSDRKFDFPLAQIAKTTVFRLVIDKMTGKQSRV